MNSCEKIAYTKRRVASPIVMRLRIEIQRLYQEAYDWNDNIYGPPRNQLGKMFIILSKLSSPTTGWWGRHTSNKILGLLEDQIRCLVSFGHIQW